MTPEQAIEALEISKHDHYADPEGLVSCDAIQPYHGPCDCGADEANARIDTVIEWIKSQNK